MNKFDVKALLEETKKQTARDIIKKINEDLTGCLNKQEELYDDWLEGRSSYDEYNKYIRFQQGYECALKNSIRDIEDDYKVGPRYILEGIKTNG